MRVFGFPPIHGNPQTRIRAGWRPQRRGVMTHGELARLAAEAAPEELPAFVGALAQAHAIALARLFRPVPMLESAEDRLLTMPEVASRLGITEHQAREMGRRGELPTIKVGERHVRVRVAALHEWMRVHEIPGIRNVGRP